MFFTQLCILLSVGLFFSACMHWGLLPLLKKNNKKTTSFLMAFGCAGLMAFSLLLGNLFACFLMGQSVEVLSQIVFLLGVIGLSAFFVFASKPALYWGSVWILCLCGTFLLPGHISFFNTLIPGVFYCFLASFLWVLFIAIMMVLDRIPLFSFLALSALYLGGAFTSTDFLKTLPGDFYNTCVFVLCLLVCITYFLKKNCIFNLGRPVVFLLSYLIGYAGVYLTALGKSVYLPVFVGYELLEITVALFLNLLLYHRFYPIQVPFLVERALMKNIMVGKVLKKIFVFCFVLSSLAALCVYSSGDYILLAYVFLGIILYNAYLNLTTWGDPKVRLRDVFKDAKSGITALKKELFNVPLKNDKKVQKSTQKQSNVPSLKKKTITKKKTASKVKKA